MLLVFLLLFSLPALGLVPVVPEMIPAVPLPGSMGAAPPVPVLLVHGIFDTAASLQPMQKALAEAGLTAQTLQLTPNDGTVGLEVLAEQVDAAVKTLRQKTAAKQVDVVGHSMGALVLRYFLQRKDGRLRVRRYISLSGPHRGVIGGFLASLPAARQMRPHSAFLNDLNADPDPMGKVEAFDFYTPFDAIIVPSTTQTLPGARIRKAFAVRTHHKMLTDKKVLSAVTQALLKGPAAFLSTP